MKTINLLIPFCLFCLIQSISVAGQVEQQQGIIRPDKQIEPNPKEGEMGKDEREEPKMLMDSPIGDDDSQKEFGKGMDEERKSDGKMDEGERSNRAKRQWGYGGYGYGGGWGGGWGRPWGGGWGSGWGRPWGGWGGGWGRGWGGGYGYGGYGGYWG